MSKSDRKASAFELLRAAYLHGVGQHPRQSERDLFRKLLSGHGDLKVETAFKTRSIQDGNPPRID